MRLFFGVHSTFGRVLRGALFPTPLYAGAADRAEDDRRYHQFLARHFACAAHGASPTVCDERRRAHGADAIGSICV